MSSLAPCEGGAPSTAPRIVVAAVLQIWANAQGMGIWYNVRMKKSLVILIETKPIAATSNVAAFYKVEGPRFYRLKVDAAQ